MSKLAEVTAYQDFETRDPKDWAKREEEVKQHAIELDKLFEPKTLGGPGSGNFGHSGRPGQVGGSGGGAGFAGFKQQALQNLDQTSRTAKGTSDTSSSENKPKLAAREGAELAAKTRVNFENALQKAWDQRGREFKDSEEVKDFANDVASTVSEGLLQPGQSLFRTWETNNDQLKPGEIQDALEDFSVELHDRLDEDPVETAAWLEKRLSVVHPWADGVGRTTKVLSAFVLARGGKNLPKYPGRDEYYKAIKGSDADFTQAFKSWM